MKIYLASSWRNEYYPDILNSLREAGHNVYDFRDEGKGFSWDKVDVDWRNWTNKKYMTALYHKESEDGFQRDLDAIHWCNTLIMLMPCGLSAGLELGYATALGKPTAVLALDHFGEPDLMVKVAGRFFTNKEDLLEWLAEENKWFSGIRSGDVTINFRNINT